MDKNIIVEIDEDGFIQSVWCPDETYVVNVLDHAAWSRNIDASLENYYKSLNEEKTNLTNCF